MATYDGERFLAAQLDSIVPQLAADDELIVSDDGSTDETVRTARLRNDPRIRILRHPDRVGYIKNFERAVLAARGEHIIFSDQDDVWLPHRLASDCEALNRKACVVSDARVVDQDLRLLHASFFKLRRASKFSATAIFFKPCFIGATLACRSAYLRTLLPFPRNIPHDFWITLNASMDRELEIVAEPLILYRRHSTTASVSATAAKRPLATIFTERTRLAFALLSRRINPWRTSFKP